MGGIWKRLTMSAREAQERCKLNLMEDSGHSSEDLNAERNGASKDQTQELSVRNKDCTGY